jgi:hypothetical protein
VATKCGILEEEQELDDMTLQKYLDMYKQPLNEESMQAIIKLTEVAGEKIRRRRKTRRREKLMKLKRRMQESSRMQRKRRTKKTTETQKSVGLGGKV